MITISDYFMGRDKTHADELTDELRENAQETVTRVNGLLLLAKEEGVEPGPVDSGWRPKAVNDKTSHAAPHSEHLVCKACDLHDTKDRDFARWCLRNTAPLCLQSGQPDLLAEIGLWMESPQWTPDWVHLQTVAPHSGRRIFVPSENPPLATPLPEEVRIRELAREAA